MKKLSLLLIFSLTFLFSITAQETKETKSSDDVSNGKNWFIGAGVQGNVFLNHDSKQTKTWEKPSLGGDLFLGKWFSHKVGARLFVEGGTLHPFFQSRKIMVDENYILGRVDFMLNLTNLFRSYSPDRFYNLIPYVGVGGVNSFSANNRPDGKDGGSSFVGAGGLLNTFRLSNHVDLFANLQVNGVDPDKLDGYHRSGGNSKPINGIFSASVGLIYNFGSASKKEIVPPPVVVQAAPKYALTVVNGKGSGSYEAGTVVNIAANCTSTQSFSGWNGDVKGVANVNGAATTYTVGTTNATLTATCKDLPKEQPKVVEPTPVKASLNPVFFQLNKSVIDANQQVNIQAAADYMKANPTAKLHVVGYADAQTGSPKYNLGLSQRRTNAVAKALVTKYKVDSSRLVLDWKGDTVQPFSVNDKNRVVMFTE